jgi:hypothetical protein
MKSAEVLVLFSLIFFYLAGFNMDGVIVIISR